MNEATIQIEEALQQNKNIPNVLLAQHVFERSLKESKELLTFVYGDIGEPFVWGHVFKKEGVYVAILVGFETWFNAKNSSQLFDRFWHHLNYLGDWYPLDSLGGNGQEVYCEFDAYDEAVEGLKGMIEAFDIGKVLSKDSQDFQCDYRVLGVYPFVSTDVTLFPYPR